MLSPLEIAAGFPVRLAERASRLPLSRFEPRVALEQSVLPALFRAPAVVSFSGGRDSSLVLAIAVEVARREGLPLPVPVTVRFAADPDPVESGWQEAVVKHLRLDDWVRVDISEELDCIGPTAQEILLRHGVLWPANVHFHVPQFEAARGGSVLTGVGGDEILSTSGWERVRSVLAGRSFPEPRDVLRLGAAIAPRPVRRLVTIARSDVSLEWLQPAAQREVVAALADEAAAEPLRWGPRFAWVLGFGYLRLGAQSLDLLAGDWDVEIRHPLLSPDFAAALASLPRGRRFANRTEALTTLFADLLPPGLASRSSKAMFVGALWGKKSRTFAAQWDGSGLDPEVVDANALRRRWHVEQTPGPHSLLQAIWLADELARQPSRSTPSMSSSASGIASQDRGRRSSHAGSALKPRNIAGS